MLRSVQSRRNEPPEQRMGFVGAGFELRVVLHAHEEGPAGKLNRLYQPAVRGHTGKGKPRPGKDIPIVIVELISVAVALGYTACTVAALHGGAGGYFAGILPLSLIHISEPTRR